jgi:hypothetical protein
MASIKKKTNVRGVMTPTINYSLWYEEDKFFSAFDRLMDGHTVGGSSVIHLLPDTV